MLFYWTIAKELQVEYLSSKIRYIKRWKVSQEEEWERTGWNRQWMKKERKDWSADFLGCWWLDQTRLILWPFSESHEQQVMRGLKYKKHERKSCHETLASQYAKAQPHHIILHDLYLFSAAAATTIRARRSSTQNSANHHSYQPWSCWHSNHLTIVTARASLCTRERIGKIHHTCFESVLTLLA